MADSWADPAREALPSRRSKLPRLARRVLRWGLVGGAGCVLTWCGLAAVGAGTAEAATTDGLDAPNLAATVGDREPVSRLVEDVDAVAGGLTGITRVPTEAESAAEPRPAADTDRAEVRPAKALTDGIDRVTKIAKSLDEGVRIPASAGVADAVAAPEGLPAAVDVPVDTQLDGARSGAVPESGVARTAADGGTSETDAAASGDGAQRTAEVPAAAEHATETVAVPAGGNGGNAPAHPLDPRAFTSSTTSGSSPAGGTAFDGGAGARTTSFHLPDVARSVTEPSLVGVVVPWNPAGKPRVSPD